MGRIVWEIIETILCVFGFIFISSIGVIIGVIIGEYIGGYIGGEDGRAPGGIIGCIIGIMISSMIPYTTACLMVASEKKWSLPTGDMILLCFLSVIPLFGWIFGGISMSKAHSEGRRTQGLVLIIISSVSFVLSIVFIMFFMFWMLLPENKNPLSTSSF